VAKNGFDDGVDDDADAEEEECFGPLLEGGALGNINGKKDGGRMASARECENQEINRQRRVKKKERSSPRRGKWQERILAE